MFSGIILYLGESHRFRINYGLAPKQIPPSNTIDNRTLYATDLYSKVANQKIFATVTVVFQATKQSQTTNGIGNYFLINKITNKFLTSVHATNTKKKCVRRTNEIIMNFWGTTIPSSSTLNWLKRCA